MPVAVLMGVIFVLAMCGGSSRPDVLGLVVLRPVLLIALLYYLYLPVTVTTRDVRSLMILLALFAGWILVQLLPIPNTLWRALPGHARFAGADSLIGATPWRPISLVPEVTLNALVSLLTPFVMVIGLETAGVRAKRAIPLVLMMLALVGALFVLAQVAMGSGPIYDVPHPTASGLFANRNHQALSLAIGIPYAALWASSKTDMIAPTARFGIASIAIVFIAGAIAVTGSRAGVALGAIGIVSLPFVVPARLWQVRTARIGAAVVCCVLLLFVGATIYFDRAQSVSRLFQMQDLSREGRIEFLPVTWSILRDFLPFGAGVSVFDPIYRTYEPDWALHLGYFNRAHNDWLDLVLGGGVVAGLLLLSLILLLGRAGWRGVRDRQHRNWTIAGVTALVQVGMASTVDYPLRTPLMAGVFALLCVAVLAPPVEPVPGRKRR